MSSSSEKKTIAIIGGTGAMGRPIIAALSETNNYILRVFTRNTQSEQAQHLAKSYSNVQLIEGNYADEQDVRKLLTSVYGVFCNTDILGCGGFKNEIDYGKRIFNIAKELSIKHFIYSSLDHTEKLMANHGGYRCPEFDGKAIVAEYIASHDPHRQMPWTIITTATYYENFQAFFAPTKDPNDPDQLIFTFPMADKPILLIALDDIAWFVRYSFENPDKSIGKNFHIAGDNITMNDLVRIFTEVTGIRAKYNAITLEEFVNALPQFPNVDFDMKESCIALFQQYLQGQVHRDFNALKAVHPALLDWRKWLEKTNWKGEHRVVQAMLESLEKK